MRKPEFYNLTVDTVLRQCNIVVIHTPTTSDKLEADLKLFELTNKWFLENSKDLVDSAREYMEYLQQVYDDFV